MTGSASHLRVIEETAAYWRVVFDNPPLNIMDADMFEGLQDVLGRMDASPSLRVVVFESANPEFYLAHFEVKDTERTLSLLKTVGPSGLPSLLDTFVRLTVLVMKTAKNRSGYDTVALANPMAPQHRREVRTIRNPRFQARVWTPAIGMRDPLPEDAAGGIQFSVTTRR